MAAMETGNTSMAKSVWRELLEISYTSALDLNLEVVEAYGTSLI